jgi:signal transduction histidine kinase
VIFNPFLRSFGKIMSIRQRFLLIIGAALLAAAISFFVLVQLVLLHEFSSLDEENALGGLMRAETAIEQEFARIYSFASAIAFWDEMYRFAQDETPTLPDEDSIDIIMRNGGVSLAMITNAANEIMVSTWLDEAQGELRSPHRTVVQKTEPYRYPALSDTAGLSGIIEQDGQLLLVLVLPILPSDMQGESAGTLLVGRELSAATLGTISEHTRSTLTLYPLSGGETLPPYVIDAQRKLANGEESLAVALDENCIASFTYLRDLSETPVFILASEQPRLVYQRGLAAVYLFIAAVFVIGIAAYLVNAYSINRFIIARVLYLQQNVERIKDSGALTERLQTEGSDELAQLTGSFNEMLTTLNDSQMALETARDTAVGNAKEKSEVLAHVSHDARTPLTIILMRVENLQRGMYGTVNARQQNALNGIRASANQMLFFFNNLLAAAKSEGGTVEAALEHFTPEMLSADLCALLEPVAADKELAFSCGVDNSLQGTVLRGDVQRLKQVIFNLADNAFKFTPVGGSVRVRFYRASFTHWAIDVKDTGSGIAAEARERIFDAFYQSPDNAPSQSVKGVGLGLSIVQKLTHEMGGSVVIESEPKVGTTFTITMRLAG